MIQLALQDIVSMTDGRLLGEADRIFMERISTDTRSLVEDDMFIALRGEQFDGHAFLQQAWQAGAGALLVQEGSMPPTTCDIPILFVDDTRIAMAKMAAYIRKHLRTRMIAVTGSNGKTTTKDLIAHVLTGHWPVAAAPKSFNNDVGVPLTIFQLTGNEEAAVLELGSNAPGEIDSLSAMCKPDIAVITSIGRAHVQAFPTTEDVAREKTAILQHVMQGGVAFVNGDDPHLTDIANSASCKVFRFGFGKDNDIRGGDLSVLPSGLSFTWNGHTLIRLPLLGRHNVYNALAAIGVAQRCGMEPDAIAARLATCKASDMRLMVEHVGDVTVLNDAYNANPDSMRAALDTLALYARQGKTVAVLGNMQEMGEQSEELHQEIGRYAVGIGIDAVIAIGDMAEAVSEGGKEMENRHAFATRDEALQTLRDTLTPGSTVLFKGSRLSRMEELLAAWKAVDA